MRSNLFDKLSFISLFSVIVLLPLFFLPFTNIPVETSKGLLLVLGLAACVVFWAMARFSDGKIVFPRSWLLVSGFSVAFMVLLSSLFSANSQISLFGMMFDIGSFYFIFTGFILMFMSSIVFKDPKKAKMLLFGVILSSAALLVFQLVYLFKPAIFSFGILAGRTGNILGSWNAFGFFSAFSCLVFLLTVEFFPVSKIGKIFINIFILLSLLFVMTVNFSLIWILLGISSLIIFVYKISITFKEAGEGSENEKIDRKRYFPIVSFVVILVSLLFFTSGKFINSFIPDSLQVLNAEVSPSLGTTVSVMKGVLAKNPLLGVGPNRFGEAWSMYKPAAINNTQFWDVSFDSGSGLLPTLVATSGSLNILVWLVFFVLFLIIGAKSTFFTVKNKENPDLVSFFILSFYLLVASFFYFTGIAIFLLLFAFIGVFIGLMSSASNEKISISFLNEQRKSFLCIFILIIVTIFSVTFPFKYIERFTSVFYFRKAISTTVTKEAENNIGKALSLYSNDLYLRAYSQIYLNNLNSLAKKETALSDVEKADLQSSFEQAINSAQLAINYNPLNYLNFQLLGSTYQALGLLGVKDAYGKAVIAYQNASNLNPLNPGLKLAMASASFTDGKIKEAKNYANVALSLKKDYIDALILLSQIEKSENNNSAALSYARAALALSPNNKNLIDYIDSLNNYAPAPASAPSPASKK